MAPKTRRTHTKSRGGCLECKRRKRKCDEGKPTCSGCATRCVPCEFPSLRSPCAGTPDDVPTAESGYHSSALEAPCPPDEAPRDSPCSQTTGHFDMADLALWHHFLTETAAAMSGPWEKEFPKLALSCDYLARGIMSLAALHLAYLNPGQRDKYEYLSAQHQDLALTPFRRAVLCVTPENCNQLFAFTAFLIIAQFAPSRPAKVVFPPLSTSLYNGPANWIACHRACDSIVKQALPHMRSGGIGELLAQGGEAADFADELTEIPDNEDDESLVYLLQHLLSLKCITTSTTVDEMESYTDAIASLRRLLAASLHTPSDSFKRRIFTAIWPTQVSDTFIRMLQEERSPALIITAHYCLLLQLCRSCWYMEHRAYDLLTAVQQSLAVEWTPYLERLVRVVQKPS